MAVIANMANKKENYLPMAENSKFLAMTIRYAKSQDGEVSASGEYLKSLLSTPPSPFLTP